MTQNLAYDFKQGTVLTSADSDVKSDWTVPNNTLSIGTSDSNSNSVQSTDIWKGNDAGNGHAAYGNYYSWSSSSGSSSGSAFHLDIGPTNDGYNIDPSYIWQYNAGQGSSVRCLAK